MDWRRGRGGRRRGARVAVRPARHRGRGRVFGGCPPLLYFDVTAVVLGRPVAVPPKIMLPMGHPEAVVPPVVLYVKIMVWGEEFPPGL